MKFTTIDTILNRLYTTINPSDINEADVIEYIGEAMSFLKVREIQTQNVIIEEVKNHEVDLPKDFQAILQIAKYNSDNDDDIKLCCLAKAVEECENNGEPVDYSTNELIKLKCDECGEDPGEQDYDYSINYNTWISNILYKEKFTPIKLATHSFFNSLVCKEKNVPYDKVRDEYTIVGEIEKKLRFSFKEGFVAISYLKTAVDEETGYPLIPDNISFITAITYYIKWKIAERMVWNGRQGYVPIAQDSEKHWLKYVKQATNYAKMPKGIDDYEMLLENTHHLLPPRKRYFKFFGKTI